ncbi:MAG: hypothetical protein NTV33_03265 [Coprothermobacterota bacterium]|jgi:hypothetical protein|nr:hypothetical protein [Coprothermobacterota bacterium]
MLTITPGEMEFAIDGLAQSGGKWRSRWEKVARFIFPLFSAFPALEILIVFP